MARQFIKGVTMLLLVVALAFVTAVASAYGQSSRKQRANIPFEFAVGDKILPAGQYETGSISNDCNVIGVRQVGSEESAARLSNLLISGARTSSGKLVFHRYGDRYFLAEVWNAGEQTGHHLFTSRAEKALKRETASVSSTRDVAQSGYATVEISAVAQY